MSRYLVMRRVMTGSWEDCGESVEAETPEAAQASVGDGEGVYRTILLDEDFEVIEYVTVTHRVEVDRAVSLQAPASAEREAWEESFRAPHGSRPTVIDPPNARHLAPVGQ